MKKLNNKGFTLVELLAVIVVLALLMVVAASSVGTALTNSKKNTLKTEAQKIITNVYQNAYSQYMLNGKIMDLSGYNGINIETAYPGQGIAGYGALTEEIEAGTGNKTGNIFIRSTDGEYKYAVKVDSSGNVKSYCVHYGTELYITEKNISVIGAYSISDNAKIGKLADGSTCNLNTAEE